MNKNRAGYYRTNLTGEAAYQSFVPSPLPPQPTIEPDQDMISLLIKANTQIATLNEIAKHIPKKIDFVTMKQGHKTYIQVAYDISERKTFEREVTPLLAIKDAYPKMLIARTYQPPYQHEGIRVVDAAEWLNEED